MPLFSTGDLLERHPDINRLVIVINAMLNAALDRGRFPAPRTVAMAGHSAGGQFVHRYIPFNPSTTITPCSCHRAASACSSATAAAILYKFIRSGAGPRNAAFREESDGL
jgi:hypothetical protein